MHQFQFESIPILGIDGIGKNWNWCIPTSVPLVGVTTGSIKLRGDGTFQEWTVKSQSPASGAKYGVVDNALLAIRLKNLKTNESDACLIRTHSNHNFKDINASNYHGSYPVSKLELIDNQLIANIDLYAYSILKPGDLNRSIAATSYLRI